MSVEPNPFDDERLIKIRESQEDPIVQYYIVRKDVPMTVGKICAQVAHGAQMFAFTYLERKSQLALPHHQDVRERINLTDMWVGGSFRKVVLGGRKKDFEKIKKELDVFAIRDAGLTEVEPGTETVLVCWPMLKSTCPKTLQRLRVLSEIQKEIQSENS